MKSDTCVTRRNKDKADDEADTNTKMTGFPPLIWEKACCKSEYFVHRQRLRCAQQNDAMPCDNNMLLQKVVKDIKPIHGVKY